MEHRGRGRGGRGSARGGDRGRGRGRGGGRGGSAGRGRGGGGGVGGGSRGGRGGYGGAAIKGTESWRGKAQKIKAKMVHKFKVKKEFYRDVKKEGLDETPEFYKEIFGESQDNDDQTHESDSDSAERSKGSRGVKRKVHDNNESDVTDDEEENVKDGDEKEYDLGAESSDDDEEEKNLKGKGTVMKGKHSMVKGAKEKPTKRPRFNPYAKLLKQREEDKKEREKAVEQAKKEREVREKGRKAYYDSRETERRRLTQKTSRGQPVMRNQVKHLLAKIKKMDEV